jgi:hypothetical protein
MDRKMPPEVRAAVTPKFNADKDVGQWNTFEITVRGNAVTVNLNGVVVFDKAKLPDLPATGKILDRSAEPGSVQAHLHQGTVTTIQPRGV